MLWRSGDKELKIYDLKTNKTSETIQNFWSYQNTKTNPITAVASGDAYRILGVSLGDTKENVLHYYERNDQKVTMMSEYAKVALEPLGTQFLPSPNRQ